MEMGDTIRHMSVEDVRRALRPHALTVQELEADTSTAVLAAQALGTSVDAIVKSLLFMIDEEPLLVLVPGDRSVDLDRLKAARGARTARLASRKEVLRITGYDVGGVPPVGHARALPAVVDVHLLDSGQVYAAAGAPNAVFAVDPHRLLQIVGGQSLDVVR